MSIRDYVSAWWAIILRLLYLARHGRADIDLFAHVLAKAEAGQAGWRTGLPADFPVWLWRVQRQLSLEARFPRGTRLGTFYYSPVLQIAERAKAVAHKFNWPAFEHSLRTRTGIVAAVDANLATHCGYSVTNYVNLMRAEYGVDPVAVQLLLGKEIARCAKHWNCAKQRSGFFDLTRLSPQRRALLLSAMAFADHERLLAICKALHAGHRLDHVGLRAVMTDEEAGRPHSIPGYGDYISTLALTVPALFTVAILGCHDHIAKQREVLRVFCPPSGGRGGSHARRPLIHYYGLETLDLLTIGTLEIATTMAALLRWSARHPDVMRSHKGKTRAASVAGDIVDEVIAAEGWPPRAWTFACRRTAKVRRSYLLGTAEFGGGGRFDPQYWLNPDRDHRLFLFLSKPTKPPQRHNGTLARQRRCWRTLMTAFAAALKPMLRESPARASIIAEAMAHITSSHTPLTYDPIFVAMLRHQNRIMGYKATRGAGASKSSPAIPKTLGKRILGTKIHRLANPAIGPLDFPPEGEVDATTVRDWLAPLRKRRSRRSERRPPRLRCGGG